MFGGSNGNCSTMSVVEDFFEKFEKGELREVERAVAVDATGGTQEITIEDLVSVEEVVAILVDSGDGFTPALESTSAESLVGAVEDSITDNVVTVQYLATQDTDSAGVTTEADDISPGDTSVKVIARGY